MDGIRGLAGRVKFWYFPAMKRERLVAEAQRIQRGFSEVIGGGLQLSALFETLPMIAFLAKDRQSRFVRANARALRIFNLQQEWEIIGRSDADFFPRVMAESFVEEDRRVMASGETRTYYSQLVPDIAGTLNWYVVSVSPLHDIRRRVCGVALALYDLHEVGGVVQPFSQLEPALRHLHTRYREEITTTQLAALCHLSPRHFTRVFHGLLGEPPMRYLIRQRVRAACEELVATDLTVGRIAAELGFYDQSAFTRAFRAETGLTPRQYRLRHLVRA